MELVSREDAKRNGRKLYFTGKPCRNGHICERRVDSRCCVICKRARENKYYLDNIEARRAASLANARRRKLPGYSRPCPPHCELCGKPPSGRALCLDHDHETGKFRGWLCDRCNVSLGALGDNEAGLQRALQYLHRAYIANNTAVLDSAARVGTCA
jgi:hypothetical protein